MEGYREDFANLRRQGVSPCFGGRGDGETKTTQVLVAMVAASMLLAEVES